MDITKHHPKQNHEWEALISKWQASGLSAKAFCSQHALVYTTFIQRKNRLSFPPKENASPLFLEITNSHTEACKTQDSIHLSCGSFQINFPNQCDLSKLVECLKILKEVATCS